MAGRGQWNTRFGFIMAAVGSAVGLGNLVRFPRELADNGGAAYLFVYLFLLLLVGLPAILGEMSLGKIAQLSPVKAFQQLGGKHGNKWAVVGMFGVLASLFVLFFYTVISGWALRFFLGAFTGGWVEDPTNYFGEIAFGPMAMLWHAVTAAIAVYIVARGVSGGIEKAVTVMIPTLFVIVLGIVVYALFQPGMGAGYAAIFKPDFGGLSPVNVSNAVGQVFFSLSLGQGAMLTYASYMEKKQSVAKDGTITAFADTGVAVLAGMMIFPILAFTGLMTSEVVTENTGSFGTAFIALPNAFVAMGATVGRIVGGVFFLALFFAALSSIISLLEVPTSVMVDNLKLSRPKAVIIVGLIIYAVGVVSSISEDWLNLFDAIAVNVFVVFGVALTTIFAGWVVPGVAKELDNGLRSRVGFLVVWLMRTVTPALIIAVILIGALFGTDADGNIVFWRDVCPPSDADCGGSAAGWRGLIHQFKAAFGVA